MATEQTRIRNAHSLIELMAAMVASAILLAGLASVMFIGREVAYAPTSSNHRITASQIVSELADELRWATLIFKTDAGTIEFLVPDRDEDSAPERIRYRWGPELTGEEEEAQAPLAGDPLWKSLNNGAEQCIVEHVETFELTYDDEHPVDHIEISFQVGKRDDPNVPLSTHGRFDIDIRLVNEPEVLAAHWRLDFDPDENPTTLDANADADADWIGSFNATTDLTAYGIWKPSGLLQSRPLNEFAGSTTVEVRFRNDAVLGVSENDILVGVQFPAYRQNGQFSPITVGLVAMPDGSRELVLKPQPDSADAEALIEIPNLANDFVRVRITTRSESDSLLLQVNGVDLGDYAYASLPTITGDRCVLIGTLPQGTAQFDYIDVRVRPTE